MTREIIINRRGGKYPDQIQNSMKACISIMVTGRAAGNWYKFQSTTNLKNCELLRPITDKREQDTNEQNQAGSISKFLRTGLYHLCFIF